MGQILTFFLFSVVLRLVVIVNQCQADVIILSGVSILVDFLLFVLCACLVCLPAGNLFGTKESCSRAARGEG